MAKALDVAKYFLHIAARDDADDGISNLKLQKLAYYAQGFHFGIFGEALFSEDISAWAHGPVVEDLYHNFKEYGKEPIPLKDPLFSPRNKFSQEKLEFLDEIYDVFGQFSAWSLRNMTHAEKPWADHEEDRGIIPKSEIKEYFDTRIAT